MRDRVEIDYAWKLSDAEQRWLAAFNESESGDNPQCLEYITGKRVPHEHKLRIWRESKRYQADSLSSGSLISDLVLHKINTRSIEDSLIEFIERGEELEFIVLENLKFWILRKNWSTNGKAS